MYIDQNDNSAMKIFKTAMAHEEEKFEMTRSVNNSVTLIFTTYTCCTKDDSVHLNIKLHK